jgi:aryl-alcohol dehydrogenase-like predicted oxidoreductase
VLVHNGSVAMPGGENVFVDDFTSSGTMQKRKLGNSNLEVSAIGFGCMGMSFGYGPAKKEMIAHTQSSRTQHYIFDTAQGYDEFRNEEIARESRNSNTSTLAQRLSYTFWGKVA